MSQPHCDRDPYRSVVSLASVVTALLVPSLAGAQILGSHVTVSGRLHVSDGVCEDAAPLCDGEDQVMELGVIDFDFYLPAFDWGLSDSVSFAMTWPDEWTVVDMLPCQGTTIVAGDPTMNGDVILFSTDCGADLEVPFFRLVMDCPVSGRFVIGGRDERRIQSYSCWDEAWISWYDSRRVEVGDYCGADPHEGVCNTYCERYLAATFDPWEYAVEVPIGTTYADTILVRGSSLETEDGCICGGSDYCGSSFCTGEPCFGGLQESIPWLQLQHIETSVWYYHYYRLTIDTSSLGLGTHQGRIYAYPDCTNNCQGTCMGVTVAVVEAVGVDEPIPTGPTLIFAAPRPNPAQGAVSIAFTLSDPAETTVRVFDVDGRHVETIAAQRFGRGEHTLAWAPATASAPPAPGVYFIRIDSRDASITRRVVLTR